MLCQGKGFFCSRCLIQSSSFRIWEPDPKKYPMHRGYSKRVKETQSFQMGLLYLVGGNKISKMKEKRKGEKKHAEIHLIL